MSGYVRIHRTLLDHPAFRNDAESMAFAWMIARAAWAPKRVRYKERSITLQRGQLAVSQRDMARSLDRDKAWIERLWKRLKSEAMIEVACEAGVAVITISNYSEYQADAVLCEAANEAPAKAGARQGQGTEQIREEVKKEKKEAIASCLRTAFVLPGDIPAEPWTAWEDMRERIKKPPTDKARALAVTELRRLRDEEGWPPGDVLNHCTLNSYRGIYPPSRKLKDERSHNPLQDAVTRILRTG